MKNLSIGMFDSGIGGLTVLKEVRRLLPAEHILYLGDTARVPYGGKSPDTVTRYALESAIFMLTKGVKILVIACNTSSALALDILKKKLPIPVLGVIDPGAREAARTTRTGKVGVIGTRATVRSRAYEEAVNRYDSRISVLSRPCPLFVPIVEEGLEDDPVAELMAEKYLGDIRQYGIDTLVMGCTHYPILERVIAKTAGEGTAIINTGKETAKDVRETLLRNGIADPSGTGGAEYFVTDSPDSFKEIGSRFLGEEITGITVLKSLDYKEYLLSS